VPVLAGAFADAFYLDEGAIRRAIAGHRSFNLIHLDSMLKVDVFIPSPVGNHLGTADWSKSAPMTLVHDKNSTQRRKASAKTQCLCAFALALRLCVKHHLVQSPVL
jgi:hypothetical protein